VNLSTDRYLELMSHDKKVQDGQLKLILLKSIGKAVATSEVKQHDLVAAIRQRTTDR
jgi:3-dehydroquinate synthetase